MTFKTFVEFIIKGLNDVVAPIIFALAFLVFVWGVAKYFFLSEGSDTGRETGRQFILWGLIGLVVLFSVWGLVNLLLSTLGFAPSA